MIKCLLVGESPEQVLQYASNRLKAGDEELLDALVGDLSPSHHFVLTELMAQLTNWKPGLGLSVKHYCKDLRLIKLFCGVYKPSPGWMKPEPFCCGWKLAMI